MATLSQKEWAMQIEQGMRRHDMKQQREQERRFDHLRHYLPIPIVIGIIACFLFIWLYGWRSFLEVFLSWVIGITIVTTVIALFGRKRRRR